MANKSKRAQRRAAKRTQAEHIAEFKQFCLVAAIRIRQNDPASENMAHLNYAVDRLHEVPANKYVKFINNLRSAVQRLTTGGSNAVVWEVRTLFPYSRIALTADATERRTLIENTEASAAAGYQRSIQELKNAHRKTPARLEAKIPSQASRFQNYRR